MQPSVVLHLNEHRSGIKRTFERSLPEKSQLFAQLLPSSSNHVTGAVVVITIVVPAVDIVVTGFVVVPVVVDIGFDVVVWTGVVVDFIVDVVVWTGVVVDFIVVVVVVDAAVVGLVVVVVGPAVVVAAQPYKSIISLASMSVMSKFLRMTCGAVLDKSV